MMTMDNGHLCYQQPKTALKLFEAILKRRPDSIRALYGKAKALDQLSKTYRSNEMLTEAVEICEQLISKPQYEKRLMKKNPSWYVEIGQMCIDRMRFLGEYTLGAPFNQIKNK